jgi:hypothetical protein
MVSLFIKSRPQLLTLSNCVDFPGSITPVCQDNGNLSEAKYCARTCARFATPPHACASFVTSGPNGSALVGDMAFVECDANYTLSGNGTHEPKCQDDGLFEARRTCVPIVLPPAKPNLKTAGEEIAKIAHIVRKAQETRERIELGALQVGKLAQLAAFTYEEAKTKLPCRLGFETYCQERICEAKRAQSAARIAAENATSAIEDANARLQLLESAQLAIVGKYETIRHVQVAASFCPHLRVRCADVHHRALLCCALLISHCAGRSLLHSLGIRM